MTISVIDSAAGMSRVLAATPAERAARVRELWDPMAGMYFFIPGGMDMVSAHHQNFGFPLAGPDSLDDQIRQGLDELRAADAWRRTRAAVNEGLAALTSVMPGLELPDLRVLLLLGDPSNRHFIEEAGGISGFGGISGYIVITVWPSPAVIDRLEAIVVHELHHNVRYSPGGVVWDPATVTVGEHVISEGLADMFAVELYGQRGYTHFVSDATRKDDAVLAKVVSGLGVTGMSDFASWVLGDATAEFFGAAPVGLPTGAGYAAGARLVGAYLDVTGTTAATSTRTPAADILDVALPRFGLEPGAEH
ncbi:DUF2268 domain-containing protein [Propioniciclava soli]|uniref:DUF2268 domain-containing protein n=1 Tax=Propioniciclava soli TaxID=2775081 RepID=UPI001E46F0A1|nr:DUF2268 domain-containing putative Zn-dependent protease [Propioniciclava soli]